MSIRVAGQQMDIAGEMSLAGRLFRMDLVLQNMGMEQTILSDGAKMYTHMAAANMVQVIDLDRLQEELGQDLTEAFGGIDPGQQANPLKNLDPDEVLLVGREDLEGTPTYVLEAGMERAVTAFQGMGALIPATSRFWVSPKDGLPRQAVYYDKAGQQMFSQRFSKVDVTPDFSDDLFSFKPPADAQVMDMTDMIIGMQSQFRKDPARTAPSAPPPARAGGQAGPVGPGAGQKVELESGEVLEFVPEAVIHDPEAVKNLPEEVQPLLEDRGLKPGPLEIPVDD
jgi:outer membrane lipoprotein-sorting protein